MPLTTPGSFTYLYLPTNDDRGKVLRGCTPFLAEDGATLTGEDSTH